MTARFMCSLLFIHNYAILLRFSFFFFLHIYFSWNEIKLTFCELSWKSSEVSRTFESKWKNSWARSSFFVIIISAFGFTRPIFKLGMERYFISMTLFLREDKFRKKVCKSNIVIEKLRKFFIHFLSCLIIFGRLRARNVKFYAKNGRKVFIFTTKAAKIYV